ncbi:uncharacterized protein LOC141613681 [Silene latifolia]|uniref:uncharacterized protein LOC141613681 n=1 Tax=Silene latifolia TaxID=37657 RepID=UPI003D784724
MTVPTLRICKQMYSLRIQLISLKRMHDPNSRFAQRLLHVLVEQTVEQHIFVGERHCQNFDSMTSEATMLDHHSYSNGNFRHGSQVNEETAHEADSYINGTTYIRAPCEKDVRVNEAMKYYHDDHLKPQPLQMMDVSQEMVGMEPLYPTDFGNGFTEFEFQDINGRDPISDFLESTIVYHDDPRFFEVNTQGPALTERDKRENVDLMGWKKASINESGSCSGSDIEVAQSQQDTVTKIDTVEY